MTLKLRNNFQFLTSLSTGISVKSWVEKNVEKATLEWWALLLCNLMSSPSPLTFLEEESNLLWRTKYWRNQRSLRNPLVLPFALLISLLIFTKPCRVPLCTIAFSFSKRGLDTVASFRHLQTIRDIAALQPSKHPFCSWWWKVQRFPRNNLSWLSCRYIWDHVYHWGKRPGNRIEQHVRGLS